MSPRFPFCLPCHERLYIQPNSSGSCCPFSIELLDVGEGETGTPLEELIQSGFERPSMPPLRLASPDHLVDLRRVPGLRYVREQDGQIRLGAMTTHYEIETSELIRSRCPLLAETAAHIGDVQVRNMGTLGGSIAHADPASDYPAALLALEAQVRLVSSGGARVVAFQDFFLDTFTTALDPGEMVLEVVVPAEPAGTGVAYRKMVQPASGFAIVGVAARIRKEGGRIALARVGVTGLSPRPFRAIGVEALLQGTAGSGEEIQRAARETDAGAEANSDLHASADYRRQMARVYTERAVIAALARAA